MKVKSAEVGKKLVKKASKLANAAESTKCIPENPQLSNGEKMKLEFSWATHLSDEQFEWVFKLFSTNMEDMYRQSEWGYDEDLKKNELRATTSRYIIARNVEGKNMAFLHYRFVVEANEPSLYCYELQVEKEYQNQGIGSLLLNTAEKIAKKTSMDKIFATVFKYNTQSLEFFRARGYENDENYPECEAECDYYIISKSTKDVIA